MRRFLKYLQRESVWPLLVVVLAALVLLPRLDSAGFWEPSEIAVADEAHKQLEAASADPAAEAADAEAAAAEAADAEGDAATPPAKQPDTQTEPPLRGWLVGYGMKLIGGDKELGARLPMALLGVLLVALCFFLGRRLASARAGLLSALIALSFPLLVLQSRQLLSHLDLAVSTALVVYGLAGLAWPPREYGAPPAWHRALDVVWVVLGTVAGYFAGGALLGIVVPFGGLGLAALSALPQIPAARPQTPAGPVRGGRMLTGAALVLAGVAVLLLAEPLALERPLWLLLGIAPAAVGVLLFASALVPRASSDGATPTTTTTTTTTSAGARAQRPRLVAVAALSLLLAAAALMWTLAAIFDLRPPIPGERALLGYSIVSSNDYVAPLGGIWRARDDLQATFDTLFEQIAYGLFPWSALAPLALVHLAMGQRRARASFTGFVPLAWAALAWALATVMARKLGPMQYPALAAVAVGIGMWLDALLGAREQADATSDSDTAASRAFGMPLRLPVVALFVALGAMALGKDIQGFPEEVTTLNALSTVEYPKDMRVLGVPARIYWLLAGVAFGLAMACGLWLWQRHRGREARPSWYPLGRRGIAAGVLVGLGFALFLVHGWLPALSQKLSSKDLYAVYDDLRQSGEPLGVLGDPGSGLSYYASDGYEELGNRSQLEDYLQREQRVFALAPASELCALHRTLSGDTEYYVLDNSHAKFLLLSNQLSSGEIDRNPLATAILREPPEDLGRAMRVNYDDRVELVGVKMPDEAERGSSFEVTLVFRVLRPLSGAWKVFMHFDGGGLRFQGDHEPIEGRCSTAYWQAGDYIVDTFQVDAGDLSYQATDYRVYLGFFRGTHGSWKNLAVKRAADAQGQQLTVDDNDRVLLGSMRLR